MEIPRVGAVKQKDTTTEYHINMKSDGQEVVKVTRNSVFDTRQFIKRVQNYPEIYDTNHPGFKQADDKNGAWDKLAKEFSVDGESLMDVVKKLHCLHSNLLCF